MRVASASSSDLRRFYSDHLADPADAWPTVPIRVVTFVLPTLFLAAVILQPWVDAKWMFLDPLTAAEVSGDCCHTYYGFVSLAGVILWSSTTAICLFATILLLVHGRSPGMTAFALAAGLLTGWLTLDDAFLVHETVMPSLGVPQNAVLGTYAILGLAYAAASWRIALANDTWLLIAGGGGLALSLGIDVGLHSLSAGAILMEDSAKFFGIFCWASFHISTLARHLIRVGN